MRRRRQSAVTLIELLVTIGLMVILSVAIASAFVAGLDIERRHSQARTEHDKTTAMERRITQLLQGTRLSDDTTDTTTYFVGDNVGQTIGSGSSAPNSSLSNLTSNQSSNQASTQGNSSSDLGSTRLTFTTIAPGVPTLARNDSDDFETQQNNRGPIGGVAEIQIATTPVGDAGDRTGLFEREQRPSDGDPNQGGMESVLNDQVTEIGFQFWDGTSWVTTWDTINGTQRRLPAAVQVNYTLKGEAKGTPHQFIVPIPASDVTAQNPLASTTSTTAGATP